MISRLSTKAAETDPAKRLFGPQTVLKVQALVSRWGSLSERARSLLADRGCDVEALAASAPAATVAPARPAGSRLVHVGGSSSGTNSLSAAGATVLESPEERRRRAAQAAEARA